MAQQMVMDAARSGDMNLLQEALRRNPHALREMDETPFIDTPLHVAASMGQAVFAKKMMRLITPPSSVRKPNSDGFTPLHCAASTGNVDLLGAFLEASPESMEDVTIQGDTALMVALKNGRLEAFEFLVGWLFLGYHRSAGWKKKMFNLKDENGLTLSQRYSSTTTSFKPEVLELVDIIIASGDDWSRLQILHFRFLHPFLSHLRPDQKLMLGAYSGDINGLFSSLSEDPDLLERIDKVPFVDTPLHIAASVGNTIFTLEMIRLKPSFGQKMNTEGYTPLHLAIKNSQFDTMLRLVDVDNELVRVKGKDGKTPLHCTVEKGTSTADHIARLLAASPNSIFDLTDRKETAIHLAVKKDRVDALEVLYGWLVRVGKKKILTWTDDQGQNLWTIAEARNNAMVMDWLAETMSLRRLRWTPRVIARIFDHFDREKDLNNSKARATSFYGLISLGDYLRSKVSPREEMAFRLHTGKLTVSPEDRDVVLVVMALIVTATYQAMLSPPGGLWQGDPTLRFSEDTTNSSLTTTKALSLVGQTVMKKFPRYAFFASNTAAFCLSMSTILIMLPPGVEAAFPILMLLIFCYVISSYVIGYVFFLVWVFMGGFMVYAMLPNLVQLCYLKPLSKAENLFSSRSHTGYEDQ